MKPPQTAQDSRRTLIFGCGYLGRRVAKKGILSDQVVWTTTRRAAPASAGKEPEFRWLTADWTRPETLCSLPTVDQLLISVSYDRNSSVSRYQSQVEGLKNLLSVTPPETHICYISTTGVYHQIDGSWVTEESPAEPTRDSGRVHLQAERVLRDERPDSSTVLRLAGIYGRGRVPRAKDVRAGRPIASAEDGYLNLIHVEDAADAVLACWARSALGLYLISDGCPVVRGDFYREVARQLNVSQPSFERPASGSPAAARSDTNKRVSNARMRQDLVQNLRFPTYREGLSDVLATV